MDSRKFLDFIERCFDWNPLTRMTPLEALHHDWILEGLPEKVLHHHLKMFAFTEEQKEVREEYNQGLDPYKENNMLVENATVTDIQGFPANAQSKSIYEIVAEIRRDDQDRERKRLFKSQQRKEQAEKQR